MWGKYLTEHHVLIGLGLVVGILLGVLWVVWYDKPGPSDL